MSHPLCRVDASDEAPADLDVVMGYDDDFPGEVTAQQNRIRGRRIQVRSTPECVLRPRAQPLTVLELA